MQIAIALPPLRNDSRDRTARAGAYQHVLNATAAINADWVLQEWSAGRTPKCCAKCNGTRYVPDGQGSSIELLTSPILFARGHGSCGSIAACHTGHKIAEAVDGRLPAAGGGKLPAISWNAACERYFVVMGNGPDPLKPMLFHAMCNDDGKLLDVTIGMKR